MTLVTGLLKVFGSYILKAFNSLQNSLTGKKSKETEHKETKLNINEQLITKAGEDNTKQTFKELLNKNKSKQ